MNGVTLPVGDFEHAGLAVEAATVTVEPTGDPGPDRQVVAVETTHGWTYRFQRFHDDEPVTFRDKINPDGEVTTTRGRLPTCVEDYAHAVGQGEIERQGATQAEVDAAIEAAEAAMTDGGRDRPDPMDVPGFDRATGVDDPTPRAEYGDQGATWAELAGEAPPDDEPGPAHRFREDLQRGGEPFPTDRLQAFGEWTVEAVGGGACLAHGDRWLLLDLPDDVDAAGDPEFPDAVLTEAHDRGLRVSAILWRYGAVRFEDPEVRGADR